MRDASKHPKERSSAARTSRSFLWFAVFAALAYAGACGRSTLGEEGAGGADAAGGGFPSSSSTHHPHSSSGPASGGGGSSSSSGTAGGPPCGSPADCDDGDNCTTDLCVDGGCSWMPRDDDGDGFAPFECGGEDCNDKNPNVFPGHPEVCGDGSDNDCNGVADCVDPACKGVKNCGCKPDPAGEDCSNGKDDDCDGTVDCNDPKCQGTPACGCSADEKGHCDDGFDNDCDGKIDCDDSDCKNTPACQCKDTPENCFNGEDDNCNGLVDCADPECAGTAACVCTPPGSPENCSNGKDDDCDGKVDCADPECLATLACQHCTQEICDDGIDNNCDDKIDCADSTCFFDPACKAVAEICNNGLDDDHDGFADCQDPDCATTPACALEHPNCLTPLLIPGSGSYTGNTKGHIGETKGSCGGDAGEADFDFVLTKPTKVHLDSKGTSFDSVLYLRTGSCKSGKELACDDDSGGNHAAVLDFTILYPGTYYIFLDGFTVDPDSGPDEGAYKLNVDFTENPPEVCNDGIDNDGDHFVDCADPDCVDAPNCKNCNDGSPPGPEMGRGACTDGEDNDCDGLVDCADPDCKASDYYVAECCNGLDENNNGIDDDFNCRCPNNSVCPQGQFCYTHTVFACGIPCENFVGDVCPFIAPGSYCNTSTHQCEFP